MIRVGRSTFERRCPHCREWIDRRAWGRHVAACSKTPEQLQAEADDRAMRRRLVRIS